MGRIYGTYNCGCAGSINTKRSNATFERKCSLCNLLDEQEKRKKRDKK